MGAETLRRGAGGTAKAEAGRIVGCWGRGLTPDSPVGLWGGCVAEVCPSDKFRVMVTPLLRDHAVL